MSNIRKVAQLAGVSVATVSRTLKTPDVVSPETRDKVLAAVEQAGYRPNLMAIQFRSRRTNNLVVLVPVIANTFFARVISGIQHTAQAMGYRVLLCNTQGKPETEREYAELVHARQADGVIQLRASNPFGESTLAPTAELMPLVNVCEIVEEASWPTVRIDNRAAARAMTDHLISFGHKRIALIQGPVSSPLTQARMAGYKDALQAAGLNIESNLILPGSFTLDSGSLAAERLIATGNLPTAVFCENDEMAIGAIQCFRKAGLRIPEDISVAGFDDISFAAYCDPPLTTIAQPAEAFGRHAVELMAALLENKRPIQGRHLVLPFELVIRESTAPITVASSAAVLQ
ncbi:LacI family DNA-binding transcriptional regulator [Pseudomonas sp. JZ134]|uniref:LacI family DNA-binding transcriptional regulator n=1 Tax=Pseudomonas sp. JZ134 TaxID=2806615 RepID=UPI003DA1724E